MAVFFSGFTYASYIILPTVICVILIRKYREYKWGWCSTKKSLQHQICIITGGNSGIGKEVAKDLAKRKAKVILACRDLQAGRLAIEEIRKSVHTGELILMHLDLASMESIRQFAVEVQKECQQINILVNNAGVWLTKKSKTDDGFEAHFGINHLGHFLLTNLLLDCLKKSSPCRVVTVSSKLHERGKIELDNLNFEKSSPPPGRMNQPYCNSKLGNALFSKELAKREPNINTYAVCPGLTMTGLFRHYNAKFYHYIMFAPVILWHLKTPLQGAQTVIYCCVSEEEESQSGGFYQNCKPYQSRADLNDKLATDFWNSSAALVGL